MDCGLGGLAGFLRSENASLLKYPINDVVLARMDSSEADCLSRWAIAISLLAIARRVTDRYCHLGKSDLHLPRRVESSMNCFLCGKTSTQVKIDLFPLSSAARGMLQKRFGIDPKEDLAICRECIALPGNLAEKAIRREQDEQRRDLIKYALSNSRN